MKIAVLISALYKYYYYCVTLRMLILTSQLLKEPFNRPVDLFHSSITH